MNKKASEQPTMRMVEIAYLEWVGKRMAVFETLRAVARAAEFAKYMAASSLDKPLNNKLLQLCQALDALPAWVLEEIKEKRYTLKEIKEMYLPDRDLASLRSSSGEGVGEEEGLDATTR